MKQIFLMTMLFAVSALVKVNAQAMASIHDNISYNFQGQDLKPMKQDPIVAQSKEQGEPILVDTKAPMPDVSVKVMETKESKNYPVKHHPGTAIRKVSRKVWIGTKKVGGHITGAFRNLGCKTCPHFKS